MKKFLLPVLFISFLCGCSTAPIKVDTAPLVPKARIYESKFFSRISDNQAKVIFLRDRGFTGSGCIHDMYVNDEKIFSIRSNENATIYLDPDYYIFRLETGGVCPNIATSQETQLKPGAEALYRILLPSDMNLRLTRIK